MSANKENGSTARNAQENESLSTPSRTPQIDIDDQFEDMVGYVAQHVITTLRSIPVIDNGCQVPGFFTSNPFMNPAASELLPDSTPIPRFTEE